MGATINASARIAQLGDRHENGGWSPHLHVQVMLDLRGRSGDYPGVCKRSEQAEWLSRCPDPAPLLGL